MQIKDSVFYEDFGAVGDGIKDDFFAIKAAHDYANENGLSVKGTQGKTYLIHDIVGEGESASSVLIKTNVDWTGVNFTIDDRGYYRKDKNNSLIFDVIAETPMLSVSEPEEIEKIFGKRKISRGFSGKINWSDYGYDALLILKNKNQKHFIRAGGDADSGQIQSELIVVDKNGQIRPDTPFMFDYEDITEVRIYRSDDKPLTIKGGHFTHIANDTPQTREDWGSFGRGLRVYRSNVTVDGLTHVMTGALPGTKNNDEPKGPPYSGFLSVVCCTDVKLLNCTLVAKRYSGIAGTYDFSAGTANNLYLYNVNQSNYYKEDGKTPTMDYREYWGIGGTNYCKNLVYDSCLMSRYDAHCGVYNGKVINSTVCNMELIGGGDMLIEGTTFTPINFTPVMLRGDYGCTWRGTITVKDCTINSAVKTNASLISTGWYNHYFGYVCYMPNIILDNLHWKGLTSNNVFVCSYAPIDTVHLPTLVDGSVNMNPYMPPEYIKVINNNDGINYQMYDAMFYSKTKIEGISRLPSN